jgi:hypothetical protein
MGHTVTGTGTPRLTHAHTRDPGRVGGIFVVQDAPFSFFGNNDKPNWMHMDQSFSTIFVFCAYHSLTYVLYLVYYLLNNIYILFHCNLLYTASNNILCSFIHYVWGTRWACWARGRRWAHG